MKKIYNIVCDTQEEKYTILKLLRDTHINVVNVSGYYDGYIMHVEIVNDEQLQDINKELHKLFD